MKNTYSTLACVIICLVSCTTPARYITLEDNLVKELSGSSLDFKNLDIYLSRSIQLTNGVQENSLTIEDGKLVRSSKDVGKRVIIQSGTPGKVVIQPKENEIGVSFDKKDPSKFLMFGLDKKSGNYVLLAKKWYDAQGDVTYGDMVYKTSIKNSGINLLVKEERNNLRAYQNEIASGRK